MENGTRIVRIMGDSPVTVETFNESYENASGRRAARKAARQEKKAARQEKRKTQGGLLARVRNNRLQNKEKRQVARQERKTKKAEMKIQRKDMKLGARLGRKAARKASRGQEEMAPDYEMNDGMESTELGTQEVGYEQDYSQDSPESAYESDYTSDTGDDQSDSGDYSESGDYEPSEDESQTDMQEEELMEYGFDGDTQDMSFDNGMDGDDMSFSSAADGRKIGRIKRAIRKRNRTLVEKGLDASISPNNIVIPAEERSNASGETGLIGLDNQNDFDAPEKRTIMLGVDGSTTENKISWKAIFIGTVIAAGAIWAINKYGLFKKK